MTGGAEVAQRNSARRILGSVALAAIVALLPACSSPPRVEVGSPPGATAGTPAAKPPARENAEPANAGTIVRPHATWVAADWRELPGWGDDRSAEAWLAFMRSCSRAAAEWRPTCATARASGLGTLRSVAGDADVRAWLQQHLQPYRVESTGQQASGLATGYFEPVVEAARARHGAYVHPLYARPSDLDRKKPYWTRREIDTLPAAQRALRGHEIGWLRDPLDVLVLQVQGSGRLVFHDSATGGATTVRVGFAGHNDQPYKSVGRWLIDQRQLPADQASWPAIRAWAKQNPKRVEAMLHSNPRYVFFREEPLPDPELGPVGAQGVALVPGRSIAVDPLSVPYGTPVWLDTTAPLSSAPLRRLVVAQDTGVAINGAVRADYFWGWGSEAEAEAGRMKQPLRMWVLWPMPSTQ